MNLLTSHGNQWKMYPEVGARAPGTDKRFPNNLSLIIYLTHICHGGFSKM